MKPKVIILSIFAVLSLSACSLLPIPGRSSSGGTSATSKTSSNSSSKSSSSNKSSSGKSKHIVEAHTLRDSNAPIDINSKGQIVDEATWNSFRNAPDSKFSGNYNYTYRVYSGGYLTVKKFTKNGYYVSTNVSTLYYERKSGSSYYIYSYSNEGLLRSDSLVDIHDEYISTIQHEIYVHMFDFSNYYYDEYDECYHYIESTFSTYVKFQEGYLTHLFYILGMNTFEIMLSFETTIEIPEAYYYD